MSKNERLSIREKTKYIDNLINKQNGLNHNDDRAYNYIYDIVNYLIYRKVNTAKLTSEIPEEIAQNILIQVYKRFDHQSLQDLHKEANLQSIFPYLSKCVHSETSKLKTNVYGGNLPRIDESLRGTLFNKNDIIYHPTFETEAVIKIEKKVKTIITEVDTLVNEAVIIAKNKHLLVFPLLIAISRRNISLFSNYPDRLRIVMKHLYNNTKNPLDRIKF